MSRFDAMYPNCGGSKCDQCGMLCRRADAIDSLYAGRLAFMLECLLLDGNGHWDAACKLLDEYKAEWDKVNPSPPTFMGEPMPPERMSRLLMMKSARKEGANKEQT